MITITQDGKNVKVAIRPAIGAGSTEAWLYWDCGSEWYARLLADKMWEEFTTTIAAIREEEYNRGWSDKTKHKAKSTWFPHVFGKWSY